MADKSVTPESPSADEETPVASPPVVTPPPKRSPGHRGADVKDTVAEMTAKAHEISLEAGSKMAAAMKDVINAAAGLTGFVVESARDLVQYMVRRGQMTQEEADKLITQAEAAQVGRPAPPARAAEAEPVKPAPKATPAATAPAPKATAAHTAAHTTAHTAAPTETAAAAQPRTAAAKPAAGATKPKAPAPKAAAPKAAPKKPAARTAHKSDEAATKKPAAKTAAKKAATKRK